MSEPRPIQLFDVLAQQKLIRPELDCRIAAVLDSGRFIMGPEVVGGVWEGECAALLRGFFEARR